MMKVEFDKVVGITYELKENDATGPVVQVVEESHPFQFLCGQSQLLPDFEAALLDLKVGDPFEISIDCRGAYGDSDPSKIRQLPIQIFVINGEFAQHLLQIGNIVPLVDNMGRKMQGKIIKIEEDVVTLDFNHPLAGKDLYFTGKIITIRDATPSELAHGHAHAGDGHHH